VNTVADATVPEKILLAAHELEEQGQSPFSAESLIVASWQKFPQTFGLKGYADQYPDSNKVLSSIMGVKGLAGRGWLAKMGQKLYSLSRDGKHIVNRLLQLGEPEAAAPQRKVSRDQEKFLMSLLDSSAVEKFQEGRKPEMTFADACRFWNINESMQKEALDARLNRLRADLADFDRLLLLGDVVLSNGRSISGDDVGLLHKVHKHLEERFSRHLNLLRNRTTARA
jgi:hypothetical protein